MSEPKRGIFINAAPALCSIFESGKMAFEALSRSERFELDYADGPVDLKEYDFLVCNYHHAVCNWITQEYLRDFKGLSFCLVTEMRPNNPIPHTPDIFDKYLVLDPTLEDDGKFFGFPRPIEIVEDTLYEDKGYPIIGSFGFATRGKRWDLIVEEVVKDVGDKEALIRFNIPFNTYPDGAVNMEQVKRDCISKLPSEGNIRLEITHEDMNKEQLIRWCAQNTINVFFYWRDLAGLAAVTDQAISSRRPVLCSDDPTFRHVNQYCNSYPSCGVIEAIQKNKYGSDLLFEEWHPNKFLEKFESIL